MEINDPSRHSLEDTSRDYKELGRGKNTESSCITFSVGTFISFLLKAPGRKKKNNKIMATTDYTDGADKAVWMQQMPKIILESFFQHVRSKEKSQGNDQSTNGMARS